MPFSILINQSNFYMEGLNPTLKKFFLYSSLFQQRNAKTFASFYK